MKSFEDNANTSGKNPFNNMTDEQFAIIVEEGFEPGTLNCYAHLTGKICFTKSFTSSIDWIVNCYITEEGLAVDHDYDCGGNSSNSTWWTSEGKYIRNEYEDNEYTKYPSSFEEAWDNMVEYSKSL